MDGYILDTNHMSAAIAPVAPIRDRIALSRRAGLRLGTCLPVLCELEAGIQGHSRPQVLRRALRQLRSSVLLWPLEEGDATLYGAIYLRLRQQGRALSQIDMMLAALSSRMNLILLSTDRDFEALPDIRTENWLSP
jgi:tRNA(fMet)-specific endonuclease VapC